VEYEIAIMKIILVKKALKCTIGVCIFGGDECWCSVTSIENGGFFCALLSHL